MNLDWMDVAIIIGTNVLINLAMIPPGAWFIDWWIRRKYSKELQKYGSDNECTQNNESPGQ